MGTHNYLAENYAKHPAFSFSEKPYGIDSTKINSFDIDYQNFIKGNFQNPVQFNDAKVLLIEQIEEIFHQLKSQTNDQYESMFIDELECQSLRLLNEEVDYYQSIAKKHTRIKRDLDAQGLELKSNRHFFGKLSKDTLSKIAELIVPEINLFRSKASNGQFTRDDLSINCGTTINQIVKILNIDFHRQGVLDSISTYIGEKYHVAGLALELSVPESSWWRDTLGELTAPKTIYAHLDQSIIFPKAIVYLSNVSLENGPTSCYPEVYEGLHINALQEIIGRVIHIVGSQENSTLKNYYGASYHQAMSSERFRKHFMKLPEELRFHSHMGWDILHGSNIEKKFLEYENVMTGNAGTFIVFDGGRLFHRGGLIESGERVALQVIFGLKPGYYQRIKSLTSRMISKIWRIVT